MKGLNQYQALGFSLAATALFWWNSTNPWGWGAFLVNCFAALVVIGATWGMFSYYQAPLVARQTSQGFLGGLGKALRVLTTDWRTAPLWVPLRIFVGWTWLNAGWHKLTGAGWLDGGTSLQGFWQHAVATPPTGSPPIYYDAYRDLLQQLLNAHVYVWFSWFVVFGELLIGVGILLGGLVGIASFFGLLLNSTFLLSGSLSVNPVLLVCAFVLLSAYRVAGYFGLDGLWFNALDPLSAPEITEPRKTLRVAPHY